MTDFNRTPNTDGPEAPPIAQPEQSESATGLDPATGRFLPGNSHSLKHGLTSRRFQNALLPEQAALREAIAERRIEWIRDRGGDTSFGERDLINRGLQLHVVLDHLEGDMIKFGVLTSKGAARACVSLYLSVLDKLLRIYQHLGLERRQRPVNPLDAVQRAVEKANR